MLFSWQYFNEMFNILVWINEAVHYFQTTGEQLRANPKNKLALLAILMVLQMTIAVTERLYLTGVKITIYIKQFGADTFWGWDVAAAIPRDKADILGRKQENQL